MQRERPVHYLAGNALTLLVSGEAYFPALIAGLDSAQSSIFLESYIFAHDATGQAVKAALMRAAERGVAVQVLLDGFGAWSLPLSWIQSWESAGVKLLFFRPEVSVINLGHLRLRRLHRKLVVIDQTLAFVGGINIVNDTVQAGISPRVDFAVAVRGPLVGEIRQRMYQLWRQMCWMQLHPTWRHVPRLPMPSTAVGAVSAGLVVRDNARYRREIERAYLVAIANAKHEILIANAYFLPGRTLRQALLYAAQRQVRVRLLLQGHSDHPMLQYATRTLYGGFLEAGIEIYEYSHGELHAKVAVIDQTWATVGSSNIDPFSLLLAREANLVSQDAAFGAALAQAIAPLLAASQPISIAQWQSAPWWARLLPTISYAVVRLAMYLSGNAGGDYRD